MTTFFKRAWKGEAPLWQILLFAIAFPFVAGFLTGLVVGLYNGASGESAGNLALSPIWWLVQLLFYIYVAILLWKRTERSKPKVWGFLCIALVTLMMFGIMKNMFASMRMPAQAPVEASVMGEPSAELPAAARSVTEEAPAPAAAPAEEPVTEEE